jgi:RecA-family ATPase
MGQPNNAKSLLTIEIAKCATTGTDWPDGTPNTMGKCKVLMYCGEDSLSKVVIPRLKAAGADLSPGMIGFMDRKSFRTIAGDNSPEKRPLDLGEDLDTLLELAKKHPDVKMIIVDPITGVFGNKSINKNEEANPILEKLIDFCEATGIAFVGVTHVPKRSTNSAIEKIAGGSAVGGSAKSAFMLSRDPDSDDVHDHLLTMVKWNYTGEASGMKYSTVPVEVEHKGKKLKVAKIVWGESTDMIADDVLVAQNSKKDDRDRQQDKCDAWLSAHLGDTPRKSKDVYTAAAAQGYGSSTVKRSIENLKGRHIDGRKVGMGTGWWMAVPGVDFPAPKEEKLIALAADEGL